MKKSELINLINNIILNSEHISDVTSRNLVSSDNHLL